MSDGTPITIRPIRPEDEPALARFHGTLSELSVEYRYFHAMKLGSRVTHERLSRICHSDNDQDIVLVAEWTDARNGNHEIIAVARLSRFPDSDEAEFAVLVSDQWQHHGVGTTLLRRLLQIAGERHLKRIKGEIMAGNNAMQHVCERLGFRLNRSLTEATVSAEFDIP